MGKHRTTIGWTTAIATALACLFLGSVRGLPGPATGLYIHDLTMPSKRAAADIMPDGDLSKDFWRGVPHVTFDHTGDGTEHYPDSETQVASVWTPNFVYFAYWCKYRTLFMYEGEDPAKERFGLWIRDAAEVYLNPRPEHLNQYYEFEVAPNNQWVDIAIDLDKPQHGNINWNSQFEHGAQIDPRQHLWTAEMRIPVKAFSVPPLTPGTEWRLNLYRIDGPGADPQRRFLCWSLLPPGPNKSFHQPASFGLIKFLP